MKHLGIVIKYIFRSHLFYGKKKTYFCNLSLKKYYIRVVYPACEAFCGGVTIAAAENVKKLSSTAGKQAVVIWHDNHFFQLLQYAWLTRCTVLPGDISLQHILADRETREKSRTVLARIPGIVRAPEFAHSVVTDTSVEAALLVTYS